jgi:hypothetical protein
LSDGEPLRSGSMQTAVSIIALVLSIVSLFWQTVSFVLAGGRVKAVLEVGVLDAGSLVHFPADMIEQLWDGGGRAVLQGLLSGGDLQRVLVIQVRQTGRMAVAVERFNVQILGPKRARPRSRLRLTMGMTPEKGIVGGAEFPKYMEVGSASEIWLIDGEHILSHVKQLNTIGLGPAELVRVRVELHNGRWVSSPMLRLPAEMIDHAKPLN